MQLAENVVVARLDDGWVVFKGGKEELYEFNEVGGVILWLIQEGKGDVEVIVQEIVDKFEVDEERARNDVEEFLEEMEREGLVVSL